MSIFSLGRIEFVLKGPDLVAVPNGYNQRFFSGENSRSFAIFIFLKNEYSVARFFFFENKSLFRSSFESG